VFHCYLISSNFLIIHIPLIKILPCTPQWSR